MEDTYSCVVVAFVVAVEAVSRVNFLCASPSLASVVAAVEDELVWNFPSSVSFL